MARPDAANGNLPTLISNAFSLQLLLSLTNPCQFRVSVDDARDNSRSSSAPYDRAMISATMMPSSDAL